MSVPNYVAGAVVAAGGAFGYMKTGSETSLLVALAFAAVIFFSAFKMSQHGVGSKSMGFNLAIAVWLVLAGVMGFRFFNSLKFMPAGLVFVISSVMAIYNFFQASSTKSKIAKH